MSDVKVAEIMKKFKNVRIVDVAGIKVKSVGSGESLLNSGINLANLRPAVMINKTYIITQNKES